MTKQTTELTNLAPQIVELQNKIRAQYQQANQTAKKGQILFIGSSIMEIFPIEKMQKEHDLGLSKVIYNRGVRATTTADLLEHMDTLIFDLQPSKIFINIGTNDIGFNVPEQTFLKNYEQILTQIQEKLPDTKIYVMAYFPINTVADFGEEKDEHDQLYKYRSNERINRANEDVQRLAEKIGESFINVSQGLSDEDGNLRKELTFDGGHMFPGGDGYKIVLNNMKPYL